VGRRSSLSTLRTTMPVMHSGCRPAPRSYGGGARGRAGGSLSP